MDFLDTIFDKATGVFDRIVDLEIKGLELDLIKDVHAAEALRNAANEPVTPRGIDGNTLLIVGLIGAGTIAAVMLLR